MVRQDAGAPDDRYTWPTASTASEFARLIPEVIIMRVILILTAVAGLVVACGGSASEAPPGNNTPYTSDPNKTVVVGAGAAAGGGAAQTTSGNECVKLPSGACVDAKECGANERRDVIVDSAGKVVSVVCYPADATPTPVDAQGHVELGKTGNNEVVAIDGVADGVDVAGNVSSKGNNVTVYGQGAGVSVIGGNVTAEGNGFALRGVTVKGNVEISGGNNAVLVLCVIEGDVIITGNNTVIADCSILGKVILNGVNSVLVGNEIGNGISVSDANGNHQLDSGETGAAITCAAPKK